MSDSVSPAPVPSHAPAAKRRRAGAATGPGQREARQAAILAAALATFTAHGYAATRLEDVARAAGVAKGTLYLYFPDKQALFEAVVKDTVAPALSDAAALLPAYQGTTRELLHAMSEILISRIVEGPARGILLLMIAEGPRFPELAAFHHREVVARGMALIRAIAERGLARGEITSDAAVRFPQIVIAPAMTSLVWNSLFAHIAPLDVRAFIQTYRDVLLRGLGSTDA
ncbi:TetR/AcrR family transcriptional regulator [Xanthobacter sp. VTT E-85241]|uniref:TetR/AcrR family transcriptional regulator n=1 Tax=Roseixanthobacter finlandensis TaxID=3119922 RepID=UPI0037272A0E